MLLQVTSIQVEIVYAPAPEYSLSINIVGNGVVTYNGTSPYAAGSVVVLTAYPDSGWTFDGWSGDLTGTTNPDTILMNENKSVTVTFTEIPKNIESCDSSGTNKDTFVLGDDVYATGTGYQPSTTYDIYLVEDVTWVDGMAIPPRVPCTATSISSDASGDIPATLLWSNPLAVGKYDIVVDVDGDGLYYMDTDALDDNDIEVTAALGTVLASLSMFGALIGYVGFKRHRTK